MPYLDQEKTTSTRETVSNVPETFGQIRLPEADQLSRAAIRDGNRQVAAVLAATHAAAGLLASAHPAADYLKEIDSTARSLERTLTNLLTLARGPNPRRATEVDVGALIYQSLETLRTASRGPVEYLNGMPGGIIRGEAGRLQHMFLLLVGYADSVSRGGKPTAIELDVRLDSLTIRIEYISAEPRPSPTDEPAVAPSFGLAIAAGIIREHQGSLEMRNGRSGGESFLVHLPLAAAVTRDH